MEKLRRAGDVTELKIGNSFRDNRPPHFHALKCDFKPASVDPTKMGTLDVGSNNQVTVTVPHLDGSGVPQTVFKGNQRPYMKECVLIIDRVTGEVTLEKLSSNIQVKKTRQEPPHKPVPPAPSSGHHRPHTPVDLPNNCTQRSSSWTRVTSGGRKKVVNNPPKTSPPRYKSSPPQAAPWSANAGQSTLASLPMIGLDDGAPPQPEVYRPVSKQPSSSNNGHNVPPPSSASMVDDPVGTMSPSSGSSSSDSDSDNSNDDGASDSDVDSKPVPPATISHHKNGVMKNGNVAGSEDLLNDDLCLSESDSD